MTPGDTRPEPVTSALGAETGGATRDALPSPAPPGTGPSTATPPSPSGGGGSAGGSSRNDTRRERDPNRTTSRRHKRVREGGETSSFDRRTIEGDATPTQPPPREHGRNGHGKRARTVVQRSDLPVPRPAVQGLPADRFENRELSWLAFNERVLEEGLDPTVPLLERIKFLAIVSSNLDEFFMVRVAGVKRMIDAGVEETFTDGRTPRETYREVAKRARALVLRQHRAFLEDVSPRLEREGVRFLSPDRLDDQQRIFVRDYFRKMILPVVTPLAIDPGHPFPYLANRTICLAIQLSGADEGEHLPPRAMALVHIPSTVLPRFIRLPSAAPGSYDFILLEEAIRAHIDQLFHGYVVRSCCALRVTRDWDLVIDEESAGDLLKSIEEGIRARRQGAAVRLQYDANLPPETLDSLVRELELEADDVYPMQGFVAFSDLLQVYGQIDLPRLKDAPIVPQRIPALERGGSLFDAIRKGDVLVHHPFQSFDYVVRFVREAADDPNVLAIKNDALPHRRWCFSDRRGPRARGAQRQAGRRAHGAQGALRRAGEHRGRAPARAGGLPRHLRARGVEDPLQGVPRGAPRGARARVERPPPGSRLDDPPLRPPLDGQLQRAHLVGLRRLRPVLGARGSVRGRDRAVQRRHGLLQAAAVSARDHGALRPASKDARADPPRAHQRRRRARRADRRAR